MTEPIQGPFAAPETLMSDALFAKGEEMEINFGPQHPSTHGVLRVILKVDGERIIDATRSSAISTAARRSSFETAPVPPGRPLHRPHGLRRRGHEQPRLRRGGGEAARARRSRRGRATCASILSELQRISSHLLWLATHAIDIGAMTPFLYCFRERELILDLFEQYCGARLTLNCMRIGGLPHDFPVGWVDDAASFVDEFPAAVDEYESLLTNNRIWKQRTVGIGVLRPRKRSTGASPARCCAAAASTGTSARRSRTRPTPS